MRMMMKVQVDTEAGSRAIADGSLTRVMQETLGRLHPEAAYFGPENGMRTAYIVFNLEEPSQLPSITEPMFSNLKANIKVFPVMNQEDLQTGLGQLGGGS
jgi:outer membrane receptor for Fe3+-dicitrate